MIFTIPTASQTVRYRGEVRSWGDFLSAIKLALAAQKASGGAGLRFLTETITSPTAAEQISLIKQALPQAKWHSWDPTARDGARGQLPDRPTTIYHFDKADVVVSLDADFLTCGPAAVRYTRDFADRRRVTDDAEGR